MKKQEALLFGKSFGIQQDIVEKIFIKKTGLNKSQFFLSEELKLGKKDLEELSKLFKKIAFGYPIEYALGKAEFYGLDFYVDNRCLIPRNDTEIMVEKTIESISDNIVYIDVGTGSGAIPISVLNNIGDKIDKTFAIDISEKALEITKININTYNLVDKIILLKSDLLGEINFDESINYVITANLPYIKNEDFGNIDKEVILNEPAVALYGGKKTGFELYEKLIEQIISRDSFNPLNKIILFIEIGFDQKEIAINYLKYKKLKFEIFKDNGLIDRCIKIKF